MICVFCLQELFPSIGAFMFELARPENVASSVSKYTKSADIS